MKQVSVQKYRVIQSWWLWSFIGFCAMSFIGWFIFPYALYEREAQPIQFNHKVHSETAGLTCDNCHALKDDGSFSGIPPLAKCEECHADVIGTSPHEKLLVENYIKPKRQIPWLSYAKQPQNVFFSHASHIKLANLPCSECHGAHGTSDSLPDYERDRITDYSRDIAGRSLFGVQHGMKMDDCANCHKKHNVDNTCLKCHK
jgi:menaquinone reductase, multiheme cytochrome c subunit